MLTAQQNSDSIYHFIGNEGARCNLLFKKDTLVFMKNHSGIHKYILSKVELSPLKWYHIAGQWGTNGMKLFLNGTLIASNVSDVSGYESSPRTSNPLYANENDFCLGKKSYAGVDILDINTIFYFTGRIDEIRVSNIERY